MGDGTAGGIVERPQKVGLPMPATHLAVGGLHACAVLADASLACWGDNSQGQVAGRAPVAPMPTPIVVSGPVAAGAGGAHSCFIDGSGTSTCWGGNAFDQLGVTAGAPTIVRSPGEPVLDLFNTSSLTGGVHHTCAVTTVGDLWCWGDNAYGQLGRGIGSGGFPQALTVSGPARVASAGERFTCALLRSGQVQCWGEDAQGQLGNGPLAGSTSRPGSGPTLTSVAALSAGTTHACAIDGAGQVHCWGSNRSQQVGQVSLAAFHTPMPVSMPPNAVLIAAGGGHSCAWTSAGQVLCWGNNQSGELGRGTAPADDHVPAPVQPAL